MAHEIIRVRTTCITACPFIPQSTCLYSTAVNSVTLQTVQIVSFPSTTTKNQRSHCCQFSFRSDKTLLECCARAVQYELRMSVVVKPSLRWCHSLGIDPRRAHYFDDFPFFSLSKNLLWSVILSESRASTTNKANITYWLWVCALCMRRRHTVTCGREACQKIYCKYIPRSRSDHRRQLHAIQMEALKPQSSTLIPAHTRSHIFTAISERFRPFRRHTKQPNNNSHTLYAARIELQAYDDIAIHPVRAHISHRRQHFHAAGRIDEARLVISFVLILATSRRSFNQTVSHLIAFLCDWLKYARFLSIVLTKNLNISQLYLYRVCMSSAKPAIIDVNCICKQTKMLKTNGRLNNCVLCWQFQWFNYRWIEWMRTTITKKWWTCLIYENYAFVRTTLLANSTHSNRTVWH